MSKTKVVVGPPPGSPASSSTKGTAKPLRRRLQMEVPLPSQIADNLSKPTDDIVDLNFKVAESFHRSFKAEASLRGWSMKELLENALKAFRETHGDATKGSLFSD